MRIVGLQNRTEIELDPLRAYRRGRVLDAMLRHAAPPIQRGVTRGSHEHFNRLDAQRQKQIARALNGEQDLLDKQVLSRIRDDLKNDE